MIAFQRFRCLSFVLLCGFVFSGCDEIFKTKYDGQKGDIVWIGNGLRLERNHGVVVDILDADSGLQSFLLSQDRLLPLVRDEGSRESVPVRLDWAVADLGGVGPTLQFKMLDRDSTCHRYHLSRESLICHEALNSLEIKEGTLPVAMDHERLLYVDLFDSLHLLELDSNQIKDIMISGDVGQFFTFSNRFVLAQTKDQLEWTCWEKSLRSPGFQSCESVSIEGFDHFVKLSSGEVMAINFSGLQKERGFYQLLLKDGTLEFELQAAIPNEWSFLSLGENPDLLRIETPDRKEHWLRVVPAGFEWIELRSKSEVQDLQLLQENDFFLSKIEGEMFELCERETDGLVSIAKCQPLRRLDDYRFVDMILFRQNHDSPVKLLTVSSSRLTPIADQHSYLISTYEVRRGFEGDFYLVELSELGFRSPIIGIKTYDLRLAKTDSRD